MIFYTLVILLLTLFYAMAIASFQPWDLAIGAALSIGLLLLCRPQIPIDQHQANPPLYQRALHFPLFIAAVWLDILTDTWRVVLMVLGIRPPRQPDFVEIAIGNRSETGSAINGFVNTVSPGSYLVEVDQKRGTILFHVVDADDPQAVREAYQRKYRQRQRAVFP